MHQVRAIFGSTLTVLCFSLHSGSQETGSRLLGKFQATTPCNETAQSLFQIPPGPQYDMMKWELALYEDSEKAQPENYIFKYTFGVARQGSRGFMDGAQTRQVEGKWRIVNNAHQRLNAVLYELVDSSHSFFFLRQNENVLQLLGANKEPLTGNGAWSYTLNRIKPASLSSNRLPQMKRIESPEFPADSAVFDGRTPCYYPLLALSGASGNNCQLVKCRVILRYNTSSRQPEGFQIFTVHVGLGDARHLTTGTWAVLQGTKADPNAILYQLKPASQPPLVFLRGSDNVLFLLDGNFNCMAGDEYSSYTFNRVK